MTPEWLTDIAYRVRRFFGRRRADEDMANELAAHIELETEQLIRAGLAPDEARRQARLSFGGVEQVKEAARDAWGIRTADVVRRDLTQAMRLATHQPVFSGIVVLSLALGLAATMTVVNVAYNVLYAPLDLPRPNEIVTLMRWTGSGRDVVFRWRDIESLRAAPGASLTAWRGASAVAFRVGERREFTNVDFVDGNYFRVLEVRAGQGRLIAERDNDTAEPVVVLSREFAGLLYPGDSNVVGRVVDIRGAAFTIIGVTDSFRGVMYPATFAAAIPLGAVPLLGANGVGRDSRGQPYGRGDDRLTDMEVFRVVGRLDPDVPSAPEALGAVFNRCCAGHGEGSDSAWLEVVDASRGVPGGKGDIRHDVKGTLAMVLGGVALLLIVVCCNVAGLLLVRSAARQRELAVRLSLGASRARLVWQLVAEAIPLAIVAGLAGMLLAAWFTGAFSATLPSDWVDIAPMFEFRTRPLIVGLAAVLTAACTIGFAMYPALRVTRLAPATTLRMDSRASRTRGQGVLARGVVVAQVALTVVLVVSAALLSATLINVSRFDVGLATDRTLLVSLETRSTTYEAQGFIPVAEDITRALETVPGVRAVTLATLVPLYGGSNYQMNVGVPGAPVHDEQLTARLVVARAGYFATSGLRLIAGREFSETAGSTGDRQVVVNQEFVRRYFRGREPLGQRIDIESSSDVNRLVPAVIVGVSANAAYESPKENPQPYVYAALNRSSGFWRTMQLVVRTAGPPMAAAPTVLKAIELATPGMSARRVRDAETQVAYSTTTERLTARLAVFVSGLTLILAAIGLYGVVAYGVSRRVSELGVRLALGARAGSIVWLVTRDTAWMVLTGIALGIGLSFGATGVMRSQFYGVDAHDPFAWVGAALVLALTALAASAIPAGRATRIDPRVAMQAE
jgi:predicted permease